MPGVVLSCEVLDRSPIKLLRKQMTALKRDALKELAEWVHENIIPQQFTPGNDTRSRHEIRNAVYKNEIKKKAGTGQGKFVNNNLKGASKRRALAFRKITGTQHQATLRVETPTYFRRPFVGTFYDPVTKKQKRVLRQPDKVAETKRLSQSQKEQIRKQFQKILARKLKELPPANETRKL